MSQLSKIDKMIVIMTADLSSSSANASSSSSDTVNEIMNSTTENLMHLSQMKKLEMIYCFHCINF